MQVVYQPQGRALEYSELACNLYMGCSHGCKYCFAPACMRKTPEQWHSSPYCRSGVIGKLRKDAAFLASTGDRRPILFSFLSDPYQPMERSTRLTRQALEIIHEYKLNSKILTKGAGELIEPDLDLMKEAGTQLGITLSFSNDQSRREWEPDAASVSDRLELLKKAHGMGIRTWVSMEPVIIPEQALEVLHMAMPYVDSWKVGKINHCPDVEKSVDWIAFRNKAVSILEQNHADYYIKKSLSEL